MIKKNCLFFLSIMMIMMYVGCSPMSITDLDYASSTMKLTWSGDPVGYVQVYDKAAGTVVWLVKSSDEKSNLIMSPHTMGTIPTGTKEADNRTSLDLASGKRYAITVARYDGNGVVSDTEMVEFTAP